MKPKILMFIFILALVLQACNLPSNVPVTETPTLEIPPSTTQPPPTDTPTQTPLPTDTPPPTLTFTPTVPIAFPKEVAVNCRLGPGQEWIVLSGLSVGQSSQIVGKNSSGAWWYIVDPLNSGRNCWVAGSVTNTAGNLANIPVVETPKATVTNVSIKVNPTQLSFPGCGGLISPSKIEGTIETNGPTTVKWYFETQQAGTQSSQTTQFDTFGAKTFSTEFNPTISVGTYWVRLIVTSPDSIQAETSYKIECP